MVQRFAAHLGVGSLIFASGAATATALLESLGEDEVFQDIVEDKFFYKRADSLERRCCDSASRFFLSFSSQPISPQIFFLSLVLDRCT